jgi:anaerobic ribonucleoside-triphosphate reductase
MPHTHLSTCGECGHQVPVSHQKHTVCPNCGNDEHKSFYPIKAEVVPVKDKPVIEKHEAKAKKVDARDMGSESDFSWPKKDKKK